MTIPERDGKTPSEELERVLSSACFARSEGLSRLLRFLVERKLEGRDSELKESLIGVEVYGRKPGYDPKLDSTVRSEIARLRARLSKYYTTEGSQDPLIIELPKGSYVPVFRRPKEAPLAPGDECKRPSRIKPTVALAGLVVALGGIGWWRVQHVSAPIGIVVLPFENLSHNPANEYFADGLTDELIRNLSNIDGLSPRSRTSSFAFKGRPWS